MKRPPPTAAEKLLSMMRPREPFATCNHMDRPVPDVLVRYWHDAAILENGIVHNVQPFCQQLRRHGLCNPAKEPPGNPHDFVRHVRDVFRVHLHSSFEGEDRRIIHVHALVRDHGLTVLDCQTIHPTSHPDDGDGAAGDQVFRQVEVVSPTEPVARGREGTRAWPNGPGVSNSREHGVHEPQCARAPRLQAYREGKVSQRYFLVPFAILVMLAMSPSSAVRWENDLSTRLQSRHLKDVCTDLADWVLSYVVQSDKDILHTRLMPRVSSSWSLTRNRSIPKRTKITMTIAKTVAQRPNCNLSPKGKVSVLRGSDMVPNLFLLIICAANPIRQAKDHVQRK